VLPDMDVMNCRNLAVPMDVLQHVVRVESSFNRYAIGVVGGRLLRQPHNLPEAVATARMLRARGFNFSLGLVQVNRHNLGKYGLTLERAFDACPNLQAGARILADCQARSGNDWGRALSCYYSGNFVTGFRDGYVQRVFASMRPAPTAEQRAIPVASRLQDSNQSFRSAVTAGSPRPTLTARRIAANGDAPSAARARPSSAAPEAVATPVKLEATADPTTAAVSGQGKTVSARVDAAFVF